MTGTDPDANTTLTYSIISGNADGVFGIDQHSGELTVVDTTNLDYETTPSYTLTIQISDGTLTDTATATITVTDIDDTPPRCGTWSYSPTTPTSGAVTATLASSTDETG